MGLMKQLKQTRETLREAPGLMMQARDMAAQAQAQEFQALQSLQGTVPGAAMGGATSGEELAPIAGISLERYAQLAKTIGAQQMSGATLEAFLAQNGHTETDWQTAYDGWNAHMKANMAISTQFGVMFQRAAS
jgi:hypothetical protein